MRPPVIALLVLFIGACTQRPDLSMIHSGMSRNEVIAALGEPPSKFAILGVEYMSYNGQEVILQNDTVVQVSEHAQDTSRIEMQLSKQAIDSLIQTMDTTWTKH